jgi:hypothetical protein
MKLYIFIILLFLLSLPVFAQEETEEPLEKLPTIVVRGEDRSYLEIVRAKHIPYMLPRGEKKIAETIYRVGLPVRRRFKVKFPLLPLPLPEIFALPKRGEVFPSPPPTPSLSRRYAGEGKIALPIKARKLKVVREKEVEKELIQPPLQITFLGKKPYSPLFFPSIFLPAEKIAVIPKLRKEVTTYPLPYLTLSRRYIREAKVEIPPPLIRASFPLPKKVVAQKETLYPEVKVSISPKESHFAGFVPFRREIEVAKVKKRGEVFPSPPPTPSLSRRYIREAKGFLPVEKKTVSVRKFRVIKEIIQPPLYVFLPQRPVAKPSFPRATFKLPEISPVPLREEILPQIYQISLSQQYLSDTPTWPEKKKIFLAKRPTEEVEERKEISQVPFEVPPVTRIYFPEQIKKSEYPYLHFLVGVGGYRSFNYQLDYGREKGKGRYLLTLERKRFPKWTIYNGTNLDREEDLLQGGISWGGPGIDETRLTVQGTQQRLELPATGDTAGERIDTQISLDVGQVGIFSHWNWNIWGEKVIRNDKNTVEERWDDLSYGAGLAFYSDRFPFIIQGTANWQNLRMGEEATLAKNKYQILIQGSSSHPFSLSKSLFLDLGVGIKGIKDEKAQGVGSFKLSWYGKEEYLTGVLQVDKRFYLPGFSDLYLSQDYSRVNLKVGPVDMMNYSLSITYKNLPWIDFSLKGFVEEGKDVVWVYTDSYLNPQIIKLSRQGWKIKGSWQILPSVTLEPSYTWKTLKNRENPEGTIPHEPQSSGELLLRIKAGEWVLETGGEWWGKRYYTYDSKDILPSASRVKLKLTYRQKDWEAFVQVENNNQYFLTQDYEFPMDRLTLGVKLKLF